MADLDDVLEAIGRLDEISVETGFDDARPVDMRRPSQIRRDGFQQLERVEDLLNSAGIEDLSLAGEHDSGGVVESLPCVLDELQAEDIDIPCVLNQMPTGVSVTTSPLGEESPTYRISSADDEQPDLGLPDVLDDLDTIRALQITRATSDSQIKSAPAPSGKPDGLSGDRRPTSLPQHSTQQAGWNVTKPSGPRVNATLAKNAQAEAVKLRIFRVFMPEQQGYVTLPYRPEMTLEQVRAAIVRKRGIVLNPGSIFAFQRTHEEVGGERTLVVPLTLKDFKPPTSDKEIPLFYTLGMLAREGETEIAMFVRPEVDEVHRSGSRFF